MGTQGNITFQNVNGAINNSGTVECQGTWTQNATSGGLVGGSTGTVLLDGASQTITGTTATTFSSLTLGGSGIKTLTGISATVTGTLNLANIEFATGINFITVTTSGSITSTTGFISSLALGYLALNTNSTSTYFAPVGGPGGGLYRPITIAPATTTSNTYKIRFVQHSPTTDGYTATTTDGTVCTVNTAFYHQITQTNTDNATLTMYFSSAIDGNYGRMVHWQGAPLWTNMNSGSLNTGSYYGGLTNYLSKSAWNNFSTPAFALAKPLDPAAPTAAAVTYGTCDGFTASWTASADAVYYVIDVSTNSGFSSFVGSYNSYNIGNVTSYNVTGLTSGGSFYYRVRAVDDCGASSSSNVIGPVTPITAPNAFTTTWTGDDFVNTSFVSYPSGGGPNVSYYELWNGSVFCSSGAHIAAGGYITVAGTDLPANGSNLTYTWYAFDVCGTQSPAGTGNYVRMDNSAPSQDNVTVNSSQWICNGTNTYTITMTSTETGYSTGTGSGWNSIYALINLQGTNAGSYGGYFSWNRTGYDYSQDQVASTGNISGFASQDPGYGNTAIDLVSCTANVSGNQVTLVFTVRPNNTFPAFCSGNSVSMLTYDKVGNGNGWTNWATNFSSAQGLTLPSLANTVGITSYNVDGYITTAKKNCWYYGGSNAPAGNGAGNTGVLPDLSDMGMGNVSAGALTIPGHTSWTGLTYTYTTNGAPGSGCSFYVIDASKFGSSNPPLGASGYDQNGNGAGTDNVYTTTSCPTLPTYSSGLGTAALVFTGTTYVSYVSSSGSPVSPAAQLVNIRFTLTATNGGNWVNSGNLYYLTIPASSTFSVNVYVETQGAGGWTSGMTAYNNTNQTGCPYQTCNSLGASSSSYWYGLNYMFDSQHSLNIGGVFNPYYGRINEAFNPDFYPPVSPGITDGTWGVNQWNVFGYNSTTIGTNYEGDYQMPVLSFDTRLGVANSNAYSWNQSTSGPSGASGYQGCLFGNTNISYRFMRQGFPCGSYTLYYGNDDAATLKIDGVTMQAPGCCTPGGNAALSASYGPYFLGPNSTIEWDQVQGGGDTYAALQFNLNNTALAISSPNTLCVTNATMALTSNYAQSSSGGSTVWSVTSGGTYGSISGTTFTNTNSTTSPQTVGISVTIDGCTATQNITVYPSPTALTPPTTTNTTTQTTTGTFGNGQWDIYCYNQGDAAGGSNSWIGGYSGYYTATNGANIGFNTTTATPSWANGAQISSASNYVGCPVQATNMSWSCLRTNVACGTYIITADQDDDGQFYVNGTNYYSNTACCQSPQNVNSGNPIVIGPSDLLCWRVSQGGGGDYGEIIFTAGGAALNGGAIGANQNVCVTATIPATLTEVTAVSGGGSAAYTNGTNTYAWQYQDNCTGTWNTISGATSNTLSFSAVLPNTRCYRRQVTDRCGNVAYSNTITITAEPIPGTPIVNGSSVNFTASYCGS